jgi:dipeptidyl aminopeptidase/acylaminoacyl peptidase
MFIPGGEHALVIEDDDRGMSSVFEYDLTTQAEVRAVYIPGSGEVEDATVSRDGATLLGVTTSALKGGVHWFDPDLAQLQARLDQALPNATASIESISDDRTRLLVRTASADAPGAINLFTTADSGLHRLAYVNEQIADQHLAPVKVVSYQARDGLTIEALLTLPVGRGSSLLPLVVMPHGGPWAQDTLDYDYWQQFLANRGYVVLQPNFRGSTGYGTDFLRKGDDQLGLRMQDDITDGVQWAIAQGIVDPTRVCIVGASYGGYAAMWGIAKDPDLYRCAVSIAGVASLRREVDDFGSDLHAGRNTDSWKRMTPDFDAVSPINATERIKTPLLLIHGQKDVTVSPDQSSKMYNRMKKAGKNVELLLLPMADHYYSRQADRIALLSAIEKFLTTYNPAE